MGLQSFTLFSILLALSSAHFGVEYPEWRAPSLGEDKAPEVSQWTYPCANVNETSDNSDRTLWPPTGGSIKLDAHHPWALTYVTLGLGTNVTNFNISLVNNFNQTGTGTFCIKETGRAALEAGLAEAGLNTSQLEGMQASLQIIQIGETGSSLYNCADITFNSTAQLLSDEECTNGTGVAGVAIQNADTAAPPPAQPSNIAGALEPAVGGSLLAMLVGSMFVLM